MSNYGDFSVNPGNAKKFSEEHLLKAYEWGWQELRKNGVVGNVAGWLRRFISHSGSARSLQIGVKDALGRLGSNFETADLFEKSDRIDHNCDVLALPFQDATFQCVHCQSILEHVTDPVRAISEIHRVLKPGGWAWVQLPWTMHYHKWPEDYWRASPAGLRIWMREFNEIKAGAIKLNDSVLTISSLFIGERD